MNIPINIPNHKRKKLRERDSLVKVILCVHIFKGFRN